MATGDSTPPSRPIDRAPAGPSSTGTAGSPAEPAAVSTTTVRTDSVTTVAEGNGTARFVPDWAGTYCNPAKAVPSLSETGRTTIGRTIRQTDGRTTRRWFLLAVGLLFVLYLPLQNGYWVPGGDSDFYVAIARNLALRGEFLYNGLPVAISPPGWPVVMAVALKLSPYFLPVKLLTMLCMIGSLAISYFIAVRFLSPRMSAIAIVLTGLLMPVYSLTYFPHSEGLYCLISAAALLLAFRVREKRGRYVEQVLLVLLCLAIPLVRWAGVFQLLPIVAVLLSDRWRLNCNRRWVLSVICAVVIIATWLGTRQALTLTKDQLQALNAAGGSAKVDEDVVLPPDEVAGVEIAPVVATGTSAIAVEYAERFYKSGQWFSWLLWYPSRFASVSNSATVLVTLGGWCVIITIGYLVVTSLRRGELLWLSLAAYCGGLCMNWPNPNARYFVPVAPLIVVAILLSVRQLGERFSTDVFDWPKWLRRAFVYSILLCNLAMYGVDVQIMRSQNFYADFEAGQHQDLVNIAAYLNNLPPRPLTDSVPGDLYYRPRDGEIIINERYVNLGRARRSKAGMRAMVLLTDRNIKPLATKSDVALVPAEVGEDGVLRFPTSTIRDVRKKRGKWLLVQTPAVPWRVWHFRLPRPIYERLAKIPNLPDSGGWKLYFYNSQTSELIEQPVPTVEDWPRRVPGM